MVISNGHNQHLLPLKRYVTDAIATVLLTSSKQIYIYRDLLNTEVKSCLKQKKSFDIYDTLYNISTILEPILVVSILYIEQIVAVAVTYTF